MQFVDWLIQALQSHGELALFLSLGLGYALGKLRLGSFKVGPVLGCLIAGVLVGQLDVPVSRDLKYAFFLLFLFAIGYKTGPQFFSGLKSSGLPQTGLTVFLCGTGLATACMAQLCGWQCAAGPVGHAGRAADDRLGPGWGTAACLLPKTAGNIHI